jgi:hypothetical protein
MLTDSLRNDQPSRTEGATALRQIRERFCTSSISLFEHAHSNKTSIKRVAVGIFFILLLIVGVSSYRDYGISWDEPSQRLIGGVTVKYLGETLAPSLLTQKVQSYPPLKDFHDINYGVAFEAPAVVLEQLLDITDDRDVFMFRHLLTFLVALAGIYFVQRMADRRFSDWRIGVLAALFLVLTPRLFAESFYNSKDIVFMAFFAIAMNTTISFVLTPSLKTAVLHGLATAAAIDVRIMAVILPLATVTILIVRLLKRELPIPATCRALVVYLSAACILVLAMWPSLWSDPIGNFVKGFTNMSNFRFDNDVLYMGRFVRSTNLPWHYVLVWISITTPFLYLALFLVGAFNTFRQVASRGIGLWRGDEELQDVVFFGLFAAPIAVVILLHSAHYDGWRHLYFIYPAFLLLATRGWVSLWGYDSATIRKLALAVVTAIAIVHTASWMWKTHPFQNIYFNAFAGKNLRSRYELDYWGLANRKALEYILENDHSEVIDVRADSATPLVVARKIIDVQDRKRLRVRHSEDRDLARYVVTNYRLVKDPDDAKYAKDYDLFYQIDVDNEIILSVFRRKGEP